MSDQGKWFKLWCSCLTDPSLSNLSLEDFARWCKLGCHIKTHGEKGILRIIPPAKDLCFLFDVVTFDDVISCIKKLPNITISRDGVYVVTFSNWHKYQVDSSAERMAKMRGKVTVQEEKRREEKRREKEENKKEKKKICAHPTLEDVQAYCEERNNGVDPLKWYDYYAANGWKVGRNPMRDWQAAVRTWERNNGNGKMKGKEQWEITLDSL